MLAADQLGAFILVLANSLQDKALHEALAPQLTATFSEMKERFTQNKISAGDDDVQVFEALMQSGIEHYRPWQQKSLGPWRAAFNPFRALRPQRSSADRFDSLTRAFDEQRFHFDKAFLKPEILGEEQFRRHTLRVLYHKFPFAAYHLLILLDPQLHHSQFMSASSLELMWALASQVAQSIPGFGLAYNSLGASASVNHLHVHGFIDNQSFAIEKAMWQHNGGDKPYPLTCFPQYSAQQCSAFIDQLNKDNQPYNLLMRPSVCYVIPRPPQGQRKLPQWLGDAGWYELCGGFNLVHDQHFDNLTLEAIESGLSRMKL